MIKNAYKAHFHHNFPGFIAFEWMCPRTRARVGVADGNSSGIHEGWGDGPGRYLSGAAFLRQSVLAQTTSAQAQGKKLVVIFQRGAADGLNIVVPHAETNYYQLRPTIAIPQNQLIDPGWILRIAPGHAIVQTPL